VGEEKIGVSNLVVLLALAIEVGNVADRVAHTEGTAAKAMHLTALTDELFALPTVNFSKIGTEVKDLDEAERAELYQILKQKFDIVDDRLETVIEGAVGIVIKASALVQEAIALAALLKKPEVAA